MRPPPSSTLFPYTTLFRSRPPPAPATHTLAAAPRLRDSPGDALLLDRKSTRLNSSHVKISYAVFCLKKKILIGDILDHHPLSAHHRTRYPTPPIAAITQLL